MWLKYFSPTIQKEFRETFLGFFSHPDVSGGFTAFGWTRAVNSASLFVARHFPKGEQASSQ
jgi:hypothetical protein